MINNSAMKKYLIIAAAVAATVGCAKSSSVYEENDQKITFAPIANTLTKGYGAMSGSYNTGESFKVWAQWIDAASGTAWNAAGARAEYIKGAEFKKGASDVWEGGEYYWPKTGSLLFAAVSPYTLPAGTASLTYNQTTREIKVSDFVQGAYDNALGSSGQVDLMWVDIPATSTGKVATHPMTFRHALSWITFRASTDTDNLYTITGLNIKKASSAEQAIYNKGTFTSDGTTSTWSIDEMTSTEYALYADEAGTVLAKTAASTIADNLLVLPQSTGNRLQLEIKFRQTGIDAEQTMTVAFPMVTWAMKTHYIYTLQFKASGTGPDDNLKITITPSVEDWADGGDTAIAAE